MLLAEDSPSTQNKHWNERFGAIHLTSIETYYVPDAMLVLGYKNGPITIPVFTGFSSHQNDVMDEHRMPWNTKAGQLAWS